MMILQWSTCFTPEFLSLTTPIGIFSCFLIGLCYTHRHASTMVVPLSREDSCFVWQHAVSDAT